jgi:hypothetical protein
VRETAIPIGFSQRIRLEWLEYTANLVLAGNSPRVINEELQNLLRDKLSVGNDPERGNREKTITILMKVWALPRPELLQFHSDGLNLLKETALTNHLVLHWGMVMAVYPFAEIVAFQVGRLLRLQGTAAATHVQRRVKELLGERETVSRAARRVIRSFIDWEVLGESGERGVYIPSRIEFISDNRLLIWLVEAMLHVYKSGSSNLKTLIDSPSLFPFKYELLSSSLFTGSERIEVLRQGLDDDIVILRSRVK